VIHDVRQWARFHRKRLTLRVLVLGGTGLIGTAVVRELVARGHELFGLARSAASAATLDHIGVRSFAGDIRSPEQWVASLPRCDAVIHMACDFNTDMGAIDRHLLDRLLPALAAQQQTPRFIYTGGCWLFGATGDLVATEATSFRPLPDFAWMVPQLHRLLASPGIRGIVLHPAMVYAGERGVFHRFAHAAANGQAVPVVGSEAVRWPLVHADDLAQLYALALERGSPGESYIAAAIEGLPVGRIARAFARRYLTGHEAPLIVTAEAVAAELGEWARGYALDQRLSGEKARRELGWTPRHLDPEGEIGFGGPPRGADSK
jgi:nucleoside-diphosphate-sugar epimerase